MCPLVLSSIAFALNVGPQSGSAFIPTAWAAAMVASYLWLRKQPWALVINQDRVSMLFPRRTVVLSSESVLESRSRNWSKEIELKIGHDWIPLRPDDFGTGVKEQLQKPLMPIMHKLLQDFESSLPKPINQSVAMQAMFVTYTAVALITVAAMLAIGLSTLGYLVVVITFAIFLVGRYLYLASRPAVLNRLSLSRLNSKHPGTIDLEDVESIVISRWHKSEEVVVTLKSQTQLRFGHYSRYYPFVRDYLVNHCGNAVIDGGSNPELVLWSAFSVPYSSLHQEARLSVRPTMVESLRSRGKR